MQYSIADVEQMENFGEILAKILRPGQIVYLRGELGVGKTTIMRGVLKGYGHTGTVKSPTFTLVESYAYKEHQLYHFDLYRLQTPSELEAIGFRDYLNAEDYCFIEWPERGEGALPGANIDIKIEYADIGRTVRIDSTADLDVSFFSAFT